MPTNPDSLGVRVVQVDAPPDKPFDEPIDVENEGFKVGVVFLVAPGYNNKQVAIWRDGNDLRIRDTTNPGTGGAGHSLSDMLASSTGMTEGEHRLVRQLIHFLDDGPGEGFPSGCYKETLPAGNPFPTSEIWWESSGKTKKIVELTTTWSGAFITTEEWKMYDTDGSTVLATITDAITYSGAFEHTRTRTIVL
jgi:hypothetical protein